MEHLITVLLVIGALALIGGIIYWRRRDLTPSAPTSLDKFSLVADNKDYPGFNAPGQYQISDVKSAEDCASKCLANPACRAFGWEGPDSNRYPNTCWLKTALATGTNDQPGMHTYAMKS